MKWMVDVWISANGWGGSKLWMKWNPTNEMILMHGCDLLYNPPSKSVEPIKWNVMKRFTDDMASLLDVIDVVKMDVINESLWIICCHWSAKIKDGPMPHMPPKIVPSILWNFINIEFYFIPFSFSNPCSNFFFLFFFASIVEIDIAF